MKTKEELAKLKEECTDLAYKLNELSEEELDEVTGGVVIEPVGRNPKLVLFDKIVGFGKDQLSFEQNKVEATIPEKYKVNITVDFDGSFKKQ